MSVTVRQQDDGTFAVMADDEIVSPGHSSSSAAWRAADRIEGETVSPVESRSDYAFRRSLRQNIPVPKQRRRKSGQVGHSKPNSKPESLKPPRWLEKARKVEQRPDYQLGKFGPASAVRKISVEDYLQGK